MALCSPHQNTVIISGSGQGVQLLNHKNKFFLESSSNTSSWVYVFLTFLIFFKELIPPEDKRITIPIPIIRPSLIEYSEIWYKQPDFNSIKVF